MRAYVVLVVLVLMSLVGCGYAEKQEQAAAYERFLKDSLGTVAADPPPALAAGEHRSAEGAL